MTDKEIILGKIEGFAGLGPDWDGEGAAVISPRAIAVAKAVISQPSTRVRGCWPVPTHDGGVQLEWSAQNPRLYLEVEITPEGGVEVFVVGGDASEEEDSFHIVIPPCQTT
jgi:hypothetical protein